MIDRRVRACCPSFPSAALVLAAVLAWTPAIGRAAGDRAGNGTADGHDVVAPPAAMAEDAETAAEVADAAGVAESAEPAHQARPWMISVGLGLATGLGGWEDQSNETATSSHTVRHSILEGFRAHITLGYRVHQNLMPILRVGFGGGTFSYRQPGFGPEPGFDPDAPRRDVRYGHFQLGFGIRAGVDPLEQLRLSASVGLLVFLPLEEEFTYRRNDGLSRQVWNLTYTAGVGLFTGIAVEYQLSAAVGLQLDLSVDLVNTRWNQLVRRRGTGAYQPTGSSTWTGTIDYDTGDFVDGTPDGDGFSIRRHASSDGGVDGLIGAVAITITVVFRFG